MEMFTISEDLWVRADEDKYNERKELARKSTEVSKHYIECLDQWNWAPRHSRVKLQQEGGRKKVEQPLNVKVKE